VRLPHPSLLPRELGLVRPHDQKKGCPTRRFVTGGVAMLMVSGDFPYGKLSFLRLVYEDQSRLSIGEAAPPVAF